MSCSLADKETYSLVYDPSKAIKPPISMSKEEVDSDVRFVEFALKKSYSGYFYKNKKDVEVGIKNLKRYLAKIESIKPGEFCRLLGKSFSHVKDEHLIFQFGPKKCERKIFVGKVGKRKFAEENKLWVLREVDSKGNKILIISISWFASPSSKEWSGMLEQIKARLIEVDFVIVDLRGNGGGDDSVGYQLARVLTGQRQFSTPYGHQYKVVTNPGLDSRANLFSFFSYNSKSENEKNYFLKIIEEDKLKYRNSKEKTVVINKELSPIIKAKALKPVVILQDRACASSCESTIDFFEHIEGVTKIGENSAGQVHFGNLGFVVLPKSTIQLNIPSTYNSYRDDRFIESVGIAPDVKVSEGRDAYDFALQLINQLSTL